MEAKNAVICYLLARGSGELGVSLSPNVKAENKVSDQFLARSSRQTGSKRVQSPPSCTLCSAESSVDWQMRGSLYRFTSPREKLTSDASRNQVSFGHPLVRYACKCTDMYVYACLCAVLCTHVIKSQ
jgi:hypothetical protein